MVKTKNNDTLRAVYQFSAHGYPRAENWHSGKVGRNKKLAITIVMISAKYIDAKKPASQ